MTKREFIEALENADDRAEVFFYSNTETDII